MLSRELRERNPDIRSDVPVKDRKPVSGNHAPRTTSVSVTPGSAVHPGPLHPINPTINASANTPFLMRFSSLPLCDLLSGVKAGLVQNGLQDPRSR